MRCWPARLPHSVGTLVPVTPPVTWTYSVLHDPFSSGSVRVIVSNSILTWQMASLSGVIIRLHTEGGLAGLLKYVPFCAVLVSHSLLKLQQTPKPLAQAPSAAPPLLVHSELGNWTTLNRENGFRNLRWRPLWREVTSGR